jgi:hypothetical protein
MTRTVTAALLGLAVVAGLAAFPSSAGTFLSCSIGAPLLSRYPLERDAVAKCFEETNDAVRNLEGDVGSLRFALETVRLELSTVRLQLETLKEASR